MKGGYSNDLFSKFKIELICSFQAPHLLYTSNNFGFYAAEDLELFAFYYKDIFKNIQMIYYCLTSDDDQILKR
jgi:hypothetical protein